ncbi:MAG: glutamine--fructose-6-phosphate transaminase (isomerizing) [Nitrospiraceae bacterium]|nr:glutamine--fructose-6-phosphate transaminase (isomerizing) [Nitrospiraceae bacterium]
MCGIIGYTGKRSAVPIILEGLKLLEYRGYDSAGVAFMEDNGLKVVRCAGKIRHLEALISQNPQPRSTTSIGHTRWATHGGPSERNAHPHQSGGTVLVHNGIIENYIQLKKDLMAEGFNFKSETDTEVICHLICKYSRSLPFEKAVLEAVKELKGAYALAVMDESEPGKIIGVKKDSPLAMGVGLDEYFIGSDASAFLAHTKKALFLEDGEAVVITPEGYRLIGPGGVLSNRKPVVLQWTPGMAGKDGYKHYMLKEIHEQPHAIADTIRGRIEPEKGEVTTSSFGMPEGLLESRKKVMIAACGTSWHAGLAARYMIEPLASVPVEVDIASEYRYRSPVIRPDDLFISVTQSGETADTLAAQKLAKQSGAFTLSITNVTGSTAARGADAVFFTRSGPEIGVASTKTFSAQLAAMYLLSISFARALNKITAEESGAMLQELMCIPDKIERILNQKAQLEEMGKKFIKKDHFLFLGRGINYPVALEGALKLKEISYIHAEGYAAGEMKHGPIALIDKDMPVLFLIPARGALKEKALSNLEEVKSRNADILIITDSEDAREFGAAPENVFCVPGTNPYLLPILMAIPLQLLAYYIGVHRGCDVDQPRNLAKSVTVE